ncbi:MAG: alpha/beta fold hydrolase [Deltaproteobacteria bacterium]|nr:alpha/beta fold hydrolase [Deltaproteobacteria bacterium]
MNTAQLFEKGHGNKAVGFFIVCIIVCFIAVYIAHRIQTDFGQVQVSNVYYKNYNGRQIRAKLLRPVVKQEDQLLPGVVFIHGYQNNRESGDAYSIELARRGFVVLAIDALGRGNSDPPGDLDDPDFDETFGSRTSLDYLRSLPFVNSDSVGIMGHSMGAEYAYNIALEDPGAHAVVVIGNAYDERATKTMPKNMLMIIGEYDEFRDRMTGTTDIIAQWMQSEASQKTFPVKDPKLGVTYGDFSLGTARRVFIPRISHVQESHSRACVAETVQWLKAALRPPESLWIDADKQLWPVKELMTLLAAVAGLFSTLPLALILLRMNFFASLRGPARTEYFCPGKSYFKFATINGILMWLYLPLIMTIFAIHKFVVPIDTLFPMLLVDGIVWWFLCINIIGFFIFRAWFKHQAEATGLTLYELGVSHNEDRFWLDGGKIGRTILVGLILFGFVYLLEYLSERFFIVDFRFIYPLFSDLTPYRFNMFMIYFPFLLFGFLILTTFIHGQLRPEGKNTWLKTYFSWTLSNVLALIVPIFLFLLIQYVPLLTTGFIPFEGPGGVFVVFIIELFFIMLSLTICMILSTWFYQITGTIYLSALMNAFVITWLFASSQVIAPIP